MLFCTKCGANVSGGINFCGRCGSSLGGSAVEASEKSNSAADGKGAFATAAWNPSIVPIFVFLSSTLGLILHHMNWKSLGREGKQKTSLMWIVAGLAFEVIMYWYRSVVTDSFGRVVGGEGGTDNAVFLIALMMIAVPPILNYLFAIIWYYGGDGKTQVKYAKSELDGYQKKSWGLPIVIIIGVWILQYIIGMAYGVRKLYNYIQ